MKQKKNDVTLVLLVFYEALKFFFGFSFGMSMMPLDTSFELTATDKSVKIDARLS